MNETKPDTLQAILTAAMDEFLEKGFQSASLRNIVKQAGVTTGAFTDIFPVRKLCSKLSSENSMSIS